MYPLSLAWRNLRAHPVQTAITIVVVSLALGLFVTIAVLGDAIRQGVIRASDPFGVLVVGAKGSGQQLVLSSILLQGQPVGNIPYAIFEELAADERVQTAVPLALGDNIGGARIIGTDNSFFALTGPRGEPSPFVLADGRLLEQDFEAVLGATAATQLGLGLGQTFVSSHGVERGFEPDEHDDPFTVVGILQPSGTPYDAAVFTTLASI
jgi:putative ABC transport system permease protein